MAAGCSPNLGLSGVCLMIRRGTQGSGGNSAQVKRSSCGTSWVGDTHRASQVMLTFVTVKWYLARFPHVI